MLLMGEMEYGTPRAIRILNEFWADPVKAITAQRQASIAEYIGKWRVFVELEMEISGDGSFLKNYDWSS